ncbi:MAG: hypothetical protein V1836_03365 [Candidatus Aenigmatarchaeota archaeon]
MFTHAGFSKDSEDRRRRFLSDYMGASQRPSNDYRSLFSDLTRDYSTYADSRKRCRCYG